MGSTLLLFVFFALNITLFGTQEVSGTNRNILSIEECPVCFESISDQRPAINTGVCRHCFCQSCLNRLESCAICRAPLRLSLVDQMIVRQVIDDRLQQQMLRWLQVDQRARHRATVIIGQSETDVESELLEQQPRSRLSIRRVIFRFFSRRAHRVSPLNLEQAVLERQGEYAFLVGIEGLFSVESG